MEGEKSRKKQRVCEKRKSEGPGDKNGKKERIRQLSFLAWAIPVPWGSGKKIERKGSANSDEIKRWKSFFSDRALLRGC